MNRRPCLPAHDESLQQLRPQPVSHVRRLLWLLACVAVGAGIGAAGAALTGETAWYLAIPAVVALGWLVLANPAECEPGGGVRGPSPPPRRDA